MDKTIAKGKSSQGTFKKLLIGNFATLLTVTHNLGAKATSVTMAGSSTNRDRSGAIQPGVPTIARQGPTLLVSTLLFVAIIAGGMLFHLQQKTKTALLAEKANVEELRKNFARQEAIQRQRLLASKIKAKELEESQQIASAVQIVRVQEQDKALPMQMVVTEQVTNSKFKDATQQAITDILNRRNQQLREIIAQQKAPQQTELVKQSPCTGDCQNGTGTYIYDNGDLYVGQWKAGQRSGKGTLFYANGDKYIGQWKNDQRFGVGSKHLKFASYFAKQADLKAAAMIRQQEGKKYRNL